LRLPALYPRPVGTRGLHRLSEPVTIAGPRTSTSRPTASSVPPPTLQSRSPLWRDSDPNRQLSDRGPLPALQSRSPLRQRQWQEL
jgi:hypothetical protein